MWHLKTVLETHTKEVFSAGWGSQVLVYIVECEVAGFQNILSSGGITPTRTIFQFLQKEVAGLAWNLEAKSWGCP
jgi:hypothetical protein